MAAANAAMAGNPLIAQVFVVSVFVGVALWLWLLTRLGRGPATYLSPLVPEEEVLLGHEIEAFVAAVTKGHFEEAEQSADWAFSLYEAPPDTPAPS